VAESRRARDVAVLVAVVGALVLLAAVAAFLYLRTDETDGADPEKPPTPTVEPATVHVSFQEACDALVEEGIRGKRAKAPAVEDKDEIFYEYADPDGGGPIAGIGLTVCDRGWVIVVGVTERSAKVPSVGSNGTPVIAYVQAPFVAD
jgi:hypothetical protein